MTFFFAPHIFNCILKNKEVCFTVGLKKNIYFEKEEQPRVVLTKYEREKLKKTVNKKYKNKKKIIKE